MRSVVIIVVLVSMVCSMPEKRFLLSDIFNIQELVGSAQKMLDLLGSDLTETSCETKCHTLLQEGHVFHYGCPLLCKSAQTLAHSFHLQPASTGAPPMPTPQP